MPTASNTHHLLQLVRNLRTGRNQPVNALALELAKIRAARRSGEGATTAADQEPALGAQEKAEPGEGLG